MAGQNTETKKEVEVLCDKAGRLVGAIARRLHALKKQVEKQLIALSQSAYQMTQKTLKKGKAALKNSRPICGRLERKWALWQGEQKLNTHFTQLGAEVARLHQEQVQDILTQSRVKTLIKQIREIEQTLEKISKTIEVKQPKKAKQDKPPKKTSPKKEAGPEPV